MVILQNWRKSGYWIPVGQISINLRNVETIQPIESDGGESPDLFKVNFISGKEVYVSTLKNEEDLPKIFNFYVDQ